MENYFPDKDGNLTKRDRTNDFNNNLPSNKNTKENFNEIENKKSLNINSEKKVFIFNDDTDNISSNKLNQEIIIIDEKSVNNQTNKENGIYKKLPSNKNINNSTSIKNNEEIKIGIIENNNKNIENNIENTIEKLVNSQIDDEDRNYPDNLFKFEINKKDPIFYLA